MDEFEKEKQDEITRKEEARLAKSLSNAKRRTASPQKDSGVGLGTTSRVSASPQKVDPEVLKKQIEEAEQREREREKEKEELEATSNRYLTAKRDWDNRGLTRFEMEEEQQKMSAREKEDGFWGAEKDRMKEDQASARQKLMGVINHKVSTLKEEEGPTPEELLKAKFESFLKDHNTGQTQPKPSPVTPAAPVPAPTPQVEQITTPQYSTTSEGIDLSALDDITAALSSFQGTTFAPIRDEKMQRIGEGAVFIKEALSGSSSSFDARRFLSTIKEMGNDARLMKEEPHISENVDKLTATAVDFVKQYMSGALAVSKVEFEFAAVPVTEALVNLLNALGF